MHTKPTRREPGTGKGPTHPKTMKNTSCMVHQAPPTTAQAKHLATLTARAALKGFAVQKLGSGYMFSRWGHVAYFADLQALEQTLKRIGA